MPLPRRTGAQGLVVTFAPGRAAQPDTHECVTRRAIAARLAALKGCEYGGDYDPNCRYTEALYFVPAHTLIAGEDARSLGIESEDDFFGGVVPHPFVATKTITHPLIDKGAQAPHGWSEAFPAAVTPAVLHGYSAFSLDDARMARLRLLDTGTVRIKAALGIGGHGQVVVEDPDALDAALKAFDRDEIGLYGVALEQNLTDVMTYSVGCVRVAGLTATYFGKQKPTRDNDGQDVYGGSALTVANGDFDALRTFRLDATARTAIEQARIYDKAAHQCFPGLFASRCNYDVMTGVDADGRRVCGVLEQSWRIGGASSAELAALEAFAREPTLNAVCAECTEVYGPAPVIPDGAVVSFSGLDPFVGHITKYSTLAPYVDT